MTSIHKVSKINQTLESITGSKLKSVEAGFGFEAKKELEKQPKNVLYTIPESEKVAANMLPLNVLEKLFQK